MNYHLVLTHRCNLNCDYCHGGEADGPHTEIEYSLDDLAKFLRQDSDVQLMFYGGEPTLRIPLMTDIITRFPSARYMLQTNGLLLHHIPVGYLPYFHSILVSIDGREEITDGYRSKGVYNQVIENVRWLYEHDYKGDIVARMAVSEQTDIYQDVRHLLDLQDPHFQHVHWQLNVVWDEEENWIDFDRWVRESYYPGISRLVNDWLAKMRTGTVEGIVPFLPIMHDLLTGNKSRIRCGAGHDTFAIHVDGSIGICPISPDWPFSIVGDLWSSKPSELRDSMLFGEPCPSCKEFGLCGGRCLFANKQRLWGEEGFLKVCEAVKHLLGCLRDILPEVHRLIAQGKIALNDFVYPEFNNGCEIIP
ncbi:MAG: TIGR04084 family radical SAM/SPASM domain-containing protein [Promethearchaeota archaeon]